MRSPTSRGCPGNPRTKESPLDTKAFTGEFRVDTAYHYSFNQPEDNTIVGSSEVFRHGEFQVTQLGIGGDFHYKNVQGRLMTQFGMYSQTTPRNDASPARGQWQLDDAYRYISEAYGGYHIDAMNGINIQAGIFMSYVGLWSYYNFDNWTYQPSYVSSNTPWFFNGMRVQIFPSDKLKIEPWLVNGWQSYGKFNQAPGVGGQVLWRPNGSLSILGNQYCGTDTLGNPDRKRIHTDDSIMVKYYDNPDAALQQGGVLAHGRRRLRVRRRRQLRRRHVGRAVAVLPRLHGLQPALVRPTTGSRSPSAAARSTTRAATSCCAADQRRDGVLRARRTSPPTPATRSRPGTCRSTFDYMPSQFVTFRAEFNHRAANVPYFSGEGGVTPPGGNKGAPGSLVPGWAPDLAQDRRTA